MLEDYRKETLYFGIHFETPAKNLQKQVKGGGFVTIATS